MNDLEFIQALSDLQNPGHEKASFLRALGLAKNFAKPLLQKVTPMAGRMAYRGMAGHLGNIGAGVVGTAGKATNVLSKIPGLGGLSRAGAKMETAGSNMAYRAQQNIGRADVHGMQLDQAGRPLSKWMGQYGIPGAAGYAAMDVPVNVAMGAYNRPPAAPAPPPTATPATGMPTGGFDQEVVGQVSDAYKNMPFFKRMALSANPNFMQGHLDALNAKAQTANTMAQNFKSTPFLQRMQMSFNPAAVSSLAKTSSVTAPRSPEYADATVKRHEFLTRQLAARSMPRPEFKVSPPESGSGPVEVTTNSFPGMEAKLKSTQITPTLPERPVPNLVAPIEQAVDGYNRRWERNDQILNAPQQNWWEKLVNPANAQPEQPQGVAGARG